MQIAKDGSLVTLHWHRRLYDTRGNAHPNARRRHNFQKLRLDMQRHCAAVDIAKWRQLLTHISNRNDRAICPTITDIVDRARQYHQSCTDQLEVKLLTVYSFISILSSVCYQFQPKYVLMMMLKGCCRKLLWCCTIIQHVTHRTWTAWKHSV